MKKIKTTQLKKTPAMTTKKCFTDEKWSRKDSDIDKKLPNTQPATEAAKVTIFELEKSMTLQEMADAVHLNKKQYFTLPEIEQLVERQEGGEDVGLRINGWANLAFVENEDGCVSVLRFYRSDRRWDGDLDSFDDDYRWRAGRRLLLRNSDALTLGSFDPDLPETLEINGVKYQRI